jgi:hypothetical protein
MKKEELLNYPYRSTRCDCGRDSHRGKTGEDIAHEGILEPMMEVTVLPAMRLARFGTWGGSADSHLASNWWCGFSPTEALVIPWAATPDKIVAAARRSLAVPPEWGNTMDALIDARVERPLFAWAGTPKTQRVGHSGARWKPDRAVTQLFIPGLCRRDITAMGVLRLAHAPWHIPGDVTAG